MKIVAVNGTIHVFYNDLKTAKVLIPCKATGNYFKVGAYTQSNPTKGDKPDAFSEVWLYSAYVQHSPKLVRGA